MLLKISPSKFVFSKLYISERFNPSRVGFANSFLGIYVLRISFRSLLDPTFTSNSHLSFKIPSFDPSKLFPLEFHPFVEARSGSRQPWLVTSPYLDPGAVGHHRVVIVFAARRRLDVFLSLSPSTSAPLFRAN